MRSTLDFTPYRQSWIGFDHLFDMLENTARQAEPDGYPPFDLEQQGEDTYRIRLAVAGFKRDDIEITAKSNLLVIAGKRQEEAEGRFLYRGIAARPFERHFQLADHVVVAGATLHDGLLEVDLRREVPEAVKPRKIEIGASPSANKSDQTSRRKSRAEGARRSLGEDVKQEVLDAPGKPATRRGEATTLSGAW